MCLFFHQPTTKNKQPEHTLARSLSHIFEGEAKSDREREKESRT